MDHSCEHDATIAVMKDKVETTDETVQKIYDILTGNGEDGLVTKTALNSQSLKRLWWFVGVLTVVVLGAVARSFVA